jgi:hypothetical protein
MTDADLNDLTSIGRLRMSVILEALQAALPLVELCRSDTFVSGVIRDDAVKADAAIRKAIALVKQP